MTRALLGVAALLVMLACAASAAAAATRYAAPAGAGSAPCEAADPCPVEVALEAAAAGDDVELAPGVYEPPAPVPVGALLEVPDGVHMHGASRTARSEIRAMGRLGVRLLGEARLSDLDVSRTGEGNSGALTVENGTAERVRATTTEHSACYLSKGEIRSSVCATTDPLYSALDMSSFTSNSALVVGSTLYGAGSGVWLHQATAGESSLVTLVNTIVRGGNLRPLSSPRKRGAPRDANLLNSDYDPERVRTFGEGTTRAFDLGGNQHQPPLFVAPGRQRLQAAARLADDRRRPDRRGGIGTVRRAGRAAGPERHRRHRRARVDAAARSRGTSNVVAFTSAATDATDAAARPRPVVASGRRSSAARSAT